MSSFSPITQPDLNTKKPVGNGVNAPVYKNGVEQIASTMSADTKNSGTDLNGSASSENLSKKFKNPQVKQDVPEAGRNQYM